MKKETLLLIFLLVSSYNFVYSQQQYDEFSEDETPHQMLITPEMQQAVINYNQKINEEISVHQANGFEIFKEKKFNLASGQDGVMYVQMYEGSWYHFCFVGDPLSIKIKATLFLEGVGDLVQDKVIVSRANEFWSEFSYICPRSGIYEFRIFQKSDIERPLAYVTIFKKVTKGDGRYKM